MDTLSYKTKSLKASELDPKWFVVDAEGEVVGRLCTKIATVLRGKHKPSFTPHMDCGDYVIVVNADKVRFTGAKWDQKEYQRYSGYPGGQRSLTAREVLAKKPKDIIEKAVKGMLPKTR
ncbi:MAG: 50S ribosomal protein L13, partial [Bacteroidetes bacterium]